MHCDCYSHREHRLPEHTDHCVPVDHRFLQACTFAVVWRRCLGSLILLVTSQTRQGEEPKGGLRPGFHVHGASPHRQRQEPVFMIWVDEAGGGQFAGTTGRIP
jgi:hypothetical protein